MTVEEVRALVRVQSAANVSAVNHGITLKEALVEPRAIRVIDRQVKNGRVKDRDLNVWLVGEEKGPEGYKIILSEDWIVVWSCIQRQARQVTDFGRVVWRFAEHFSRHVAGRTRRSGRVVGNSEPSPKSGRVGHSLTVPNRAR